MSLITDDINDRIHKLTSTLDTLLSVYDTLPDAAYQVFSIEAEIRNFELRKDRLNMTISLTTCNLCKQKVPQEENTVRLGKKRSYIICSRCIKTINQVKGTAELEQLAGLNSPGTVKQDCEGPLKPLQKEFLVRKSGKFWLVHEVVNDLFYRSGRRKQNLLNSWIEEMDEKLELLEVQKKTLESIGSIIPDYHTQIFSLRHQLEDMQSKMKRIKGGKLPYRCSQCQGWLKEETNVTFFSTYTICDRCKEIVKNVMTTPEAEEKYNLSSGTIRRDNSRGLLDYYKKSGLFRLSGKTWLIHDVVLLDKYKELKEEETITYQQANIPSDLAQRSASIFNRIMEKRNELSIDG